MTFREALDTKPAGLDARHEAVARILFGRPEGVDRYEGARLIGMNDDRKFRELCSEISASGWLPIIAPMQGRDKRLYRIARPDDSAEVNDASQEDQGRAISLHKRARGRLQAFQRMHQAGGLFLEPVEPLEATR